MNRTNSSSQVSPSVISNCTGAHRFPDGPTTVAIKISVLCSMLIVALIGNTLLVMVIIRNKSLRRTMNYFLLNRAVGDIIVIVQYVPQEVVSIATGSNAWRVGGVFGELLCKLLPFIADTASVVSILSMVCMTVDRFCAVVLPMRRDLITGKIRSGTIALTWFLGMMYTSPYFYAAKMFTVGDKRFCIANWAPAFDHFQAMTVHVLLQVIVFGVLPWVLVCALYTMMVIGVKRSKSASNSSQASSQERRPSRRKQMDLRVLRLALTIVAILALSNFPHCTMLMIIAFVWKWVVACTKPPYWNNLFTTAKYLVLANTAINPAICFVFGENFRKGLRVITSNRLLFLFRKSTNNNSSINASVEERRNCLALKEFDSSRKNSGLNSALK